MIWRKKRRSEKWLDNGVQEEDQKGLPDDMSCTGIFGRNSTKTVVMKHHRIYGSRSTLTYPPGHIKASYRIYTNLVSDMSQERLRGPKNQESKKNSHGFVVRPLGQAVIPFFSSRKGEG